MSQKGDPRQQRFALYFSRATIPFLSRRAPRESKNILQTCRPLRLLTPGAAKLATLSPCLIEEAEQLEQLRFFI